MNLFDSIQQNTNLLFIDEARPGDKLTLNDLPLFLFDKTATKSLAFLYIDNGIESITAYISFLRSQHTVALLSPQLNPSFKKKLEQLYKPCFIYDVSRDLIENYSLNDKYFTRDSREKENVIHPNIKLLLNTSGSTGSPRFVKLSEHNLLSNATSISQYLPIQPSGVTPLNLPVYYSYGLSVLHSNALKGGTIVCTNKDVLRKEFWEQLTYFGFTSFAGVPFLYEMLERIGFSKKTYPSLKYFTQAGGKLNETLVAKMTDYAEANKLKFYVMYGQTEATARMSYLQPEFLKDKIGSIGKAIPGGKLKVDTGTNELCYSGPNVFGGYVDSPNDLGTFEKIDELHTGDIARMDEDGFFYITGRMKRFVKLFGSRINLDEVESLISNQMRQVVKCIGIEDKFLVLATTDEKNNEPLKEFVSKEIKIHPSVIRTWTVKEFPLTVNGKIDYTALTKNYGA